MKLSLGQALRNAIEAEKASQRFYTLLAECTDDVKAKEFLRDMAAQEERHAAKIVEFAQDAEEVEVPALPDEEVELIETMPEWAHADQIDYLSSLKIALDAENHAALYYDAISDAIAEEEGRQIFQTLSRTEEQHAQILRKLLE